jgi:hypothetical protein
LAREITRSEFAAAAFDHLATPTRFNQALSLLTEVYAVMRSDYGNRAHAGAAPGFYEPARLVDDLRPDGFEAWLVGEMERCVPGHLRLHTDIYHRWLGTNRHAVQERDVARKAELESLKRAWPTMAPDAIAEGFDPRYPYTLLHIIKTSEYVNPSQVPFGTFGDWAWSAGPLLEAARARPGVMLPQILLAVNKAPQGGSDIFRYELNQEELSEWFGERAEDMLALAAKGGEFDELDVQLKLQANRAIECVRRLYVKPEPPTA